MEQVEFIFAKPATYKPITSPIQGIEYDRKNPTWAEQGGTIRGNKNIGCGINALSYLGIISRDEADNMVTALEINPGNGTSFVQMLNAIRHKYNSPPLYEVPFELGGIPVSTDSLSNFFTFILNNFPADRILILIKLNRYDSPMGHSVILHKVGRTVWTLDPHLMTERLSFDLDSPNAERLSKVANFFNQNHFGSISLGYFKKAEVHNLSSVSVTLPEINLPHSDSESDDFPVESKAERTKERTKDVIKYNQKYQHLLSKENYNKVILDSKNIQNMVADLIWNVDLSEYRDKVGLDGQLIAYGKYLKNMFDITGETAVYDEDKINELNSLIIYMKRFSENLLSQNNGLLNTLNDKKSELQLNLKSLSVAINDIGHITAPWKQTMLSKLENLRIQITSDIEKIDGAINEFNSTRNEIDAKADEILSDINEYIDL